MTTTGSMGDVSVEQFRAVLLDAVAHIDVVQPAELRAPVSLWLRAVEERARREAWRTLLSRSVVPEWEAAQAILATAERVRGHDGDILPDGTHNYLSTACLHGGDGHRYCVAPTVTRDGDWSVIGPSYSSARDEPKSPARCKFCSARCRCPCHQELP